MMTTGGALNPPRRRKLLWGAVTAALAVAALFAAGGVHVMRAFAISGAIPFALIMIVHVGCLIVSLVQEAGPAISIQRGRGADADAVAGRPHA